VKRRTTGGLWLAIGGWCLAAFGEAVAPSSDIPPRNPFWPQGYEGVYYPITCEPRVKPKPKPKAVPRAVKVEAERKTEQTLQKQADAAAQAREAARRAEENRLWQTARDSLSFGGTMGYYVNGRQETAITINGRTYVPDDLVSSNCNGLRFTWRIKSVSSDGKISLQRVKFGTHKTEQKQ